MRLHSLAVLAFVAGTAFTGPQAQLGAGDAQCPPYGMQSREVTASPETLIRANTLAGATVRSPDGQRIGKVKGAVLDDKLDRLAYVAVESSRSFGGEYLAVPISAFQREAGGKDLILDVSAAKLRGAPHFSRARWPSPNQALSADMSRFYERESAQYRTRAQKFGSQAEIDKGSATFEPLVQLLNQDALSNDNSRFGNLSDLLVDMHEGRVLYGLISFNQLGDDLAGKMALVPWTAVRPNPREQYVQVMADRNTLRSVAFNRGQFPPLDERHLTGLSQQFDTQPYWQVYGYPPPRPAEQRSPAGSGE